MTNELALDGLLIGGVMCLLGTGLFVAGLGKLRSGLSLYRTDTTPLREIPQTAGPVEFDGTAAGPADEGAFDAPFSGEEALLCQIWVEKASTQYTDDEEGLDVDVSNSPVDGSAETTWGLAETGEIRQQFVVSDGGRVAVDPTDADLDITGHMGENVLQVGEGETLSEEARNRLARLDGTGFDASLERWDDEESAVKYREARLEPEDTVHVAGATVQSTPEQWGSGVKATVGGDAVISRGTESDVIRRHLIQFVTGTIVGLGLLGLGARTVRLAVGG
jgi:hypothetical protein